MTATTPDLSEAQTIAVAKRTAKRVRTLDARIVEHRLTRNLAMVALTRDPHNWKKLRVVKLVGVTRTMFKGVYAAAPVALPSMQGDPATIAVREHDKVKVLEAESEARRQERDAAIVSLLYDFGLPNHRIADLTGMLQVRIAQIRSSAL